MLHKSFISIKQIEECLSWSTTLPKKISHDCNGYLANLSVFGESNDVLIVPKSLNFIRHKCISLLGKCIREPQLKDFYFEIHPNGYINTHTDGVYEGYKHLRCNILLQKPKEGGVIIEDGVAINMDVGDMFVLKTWLPHSVTTVKSNIKYKSFVFGFLIKE